ncbi:hypothetical protein WMY93_031247 [Mugilogobius chulae]|uniref:Uncharacterized protein n=1 Tax=Mugilogobius chulae TaxID=88201 RepID=A0AAW0MF30_9GOBI
MAQIRQKASSELHYELHGKSAPGHDHLLLNVCRHGPCEPPLHPLPYPPPRLPHITHFVARQREEAAINLVQEADGQAHLFLRGARISASLCGSQRGRGG